MSRRGRSALQPLLTAADRRAGDHFLEGILGSIHPVLDVPCMLLQSQWLTPLALQWLRYFTSHARPQERPACIGSSQFSISKFELPVYEYELNAL